MKNLQFDLFMRYALAILAVFNLQFFYTIFRPLTSWSLFFLLSLFYKVSFTENYFFVNSVSVELIDACIAGSAYLLLLLLNLLTAKIKLYKRILLFIVSSAIFFVVNLVRLFFSISMLEKGFFTALHLTFWFLSIFFVIAIWFFCVFIFKIKEIPIYSDIKIILRFLKNPKSRE